MTNNHTILKLMPIMLASQAANWALSSDTSSSARTPRPALDRFLARKSPTKSQGRPVSAIPELKSPIASARANTDCLQQRDIVSLAEKLTILSPLSRPDTPAIVQELASPKALLNSPDCEVECKSIQETPLTYKTWEPWTDQPLFAPISPAKIQFDLKSKTLTRLPRITQVLVASSNNNINPEFAANIRKLEIVAQRKTLLHPDQIKALTDVCRKFTLSTATATKLEKEFLSDRLIAIVEAQRSLQPNRDTKRSLYRLNRVGVRLKQIGSN